MGKKKDDHRDPDAFEQAPDERGRIRLDRPFLAEEAEAQDAEHRATHEGRESRFYPGPVA